MADATYENLTAAEPARDIYQSERQALTLSPMAYESSTENQRTSDVGNDEDDSAVLTHPNAFPLEQRPE